MIILFNRIKEKIARSYRIAYFKAFTKNKNKVNILGKITVINPNVKVGKNVIIYPNVLLYGDGEIVLGDNVIIGQGTIIYASKSAGVFIGDNTMIAAQCYIIDTDHGIQANNLIRKQQNTIEKVVIENDCWLAAGCKVLKKVQLLVRKPL